VPGGVLLRTSDNTVIGGLGVSGAGWRQDEACATDASVKLKGGMMGIRQAAKIFSLTDAFDLRGHMGDKSYPITSIFTL
jgi:hypothetical protein